jgi:hypothetical protein
MARSRPDRHITEIGSATIQVLAVNDPGFRAIRVAPGRRRNQRVELKFRGFVHLAAFW